MMSPSRELILRRILDGNICVDINSRQWRGKVKVCYGLFTDGLANMRVKIDDVFFDSNSILSEVRKRRIIFNRIRSCVWAAVERSVEVSLIRKFNSKAIDGTRAGAVIGSALSVSTKKQKH